VSKRFFVENRRDDEEPSRERTLGSAPRLNNAPSADPETTLETREEPNTERRVERPERPEVLSFVEEIPVDSKASSASARSDSRNAETILGRLNSAPIAATGTSRPSTASSFAFAANPNAALTTSSHARLAFSDVSQTSSMSSSMSATCASVAASRRDALSPRSLKNAERCLPPSKYKSSPSSSSARVSFSAHAKRTSRARVEDHESESSFVAFDSTATALKCTAASVEGRLSTPLKRAGETRDASAASTTLLETETAPSSAPPLFENGIGIPALAFLSGA
jgi:hypothetical protein